MNRQCKVNIRDETSADRAAVFDLNATAFSDDAEARLVDALRESADEYISMVAVDNQEIVGHIMFTPVTLETFEWLRLMGLAPMAVSPAPLQTCCHQFRPDAGSLQGWRHRHR